MSDREQGGKKALRLSGAALKLAAALIEARPTGSLLYQVATRQLGLHLIHGVDIPAEVPPYTHPHLRVAGPDGAAGATGEGGDGER